VQQAQALLDRTERFFGLGNLGADMHGSQVHEQLLIAYDKVWAAARAV
jgi:ribosomal protein S12 methylthiotransferase accessory factor